MEIGDSGRSKRLKVAGLLELGACGDDSLRVTPADFEFLSPGPLRDGELSLRLIETRFTAGVPAYHFEIHVAGLAGGDVVDQASNAVEETAAVTAEVGTINLRPLTTPHIEQIRGHIGYAVAPAHRGHGYAARAVRLLLPLARRHGVDPLWITCEPSNRASRRTCEKAGATLVEIVPIPADDIAYELGQREKCRYALSKSDD